MEQVFRYKIPVWHPLLVHFPIVLILVATVFVLLWLARDRYQHLVVATWLQTVALAFVVASYLTGEVMKEQSEGVPIVDRLVDLHENAAVVSIWMVSLSLLALLASIFLKNHGGSRARTPFWLRLVVSLLSLLAVTAILWTAHIGGTMVWGTVK